MPHRKHTMARGIGNLNRSLVTSNVFKEDKSSWEQTCNAAKPLVVTSVNFSAWVYAAMSECKSVRSKVVSIDKSRFDQRQESVHSVSTELTIYQIRLKIFSWAVDKRTKNNVNRSIGKWLINWLCLTTSSFRGRYDWSEKQLFNLTWYSFILWSTREKTAC